MKPPFLILFAIFIAFSTAFSQKIDSIKNAKLENKKQNLHGGYYGEETSSLRRKDGERSGNDCWSASNNMWVDCKKK